MNSKIILALFALVLVPGLVFAQVIYPNRGGTGNSTTPAADDILIGNGTAFDLKTLTAGDNISFSSTSDAITITASLPGGGLASTDIDTEAELEAIVGDVTDIYTNTDGSLYADSLVSAYLVGGTGVTETLGVLTFDCSDVAGTGLSCSGETILLNATGDWTGTLDGYEAAALLDDTTLSQEQVEDYAGALFTGNTETLITVTYQDIDGTADFVVDDDLSLYDNSTSAFLTANQTITLSGDVSGSGATSITATIAANAVEESMLKAVNAPTDEYCLTYEATVGDFEWQTCGAGGISDVVDDTTPQLGGNLDVNGNSIVSVSNGNIVLLPNGTGNVQLGNFTLNADQSYGSPEDNYVLTYDDTSGLINLEATAYSIPADSITFSDIADATQVVTKCAVVENLAAADDNIDIYMPAAASTVVSVGAYCNGTCTTAASISLEDRAGNAMTHTSPTPATGSSNATFQSVTAGGSLAAGEGLRFDVDNAVSPETDTYTICFGVRIDD